MAVDTAQSPLAIVIVCYRATDLTIACLRSLAPEIASVPGVEVIICENGTSEDSARQLAAAIEREHWGDWAHLHVISPNRGFSGGNNVILRQLMQRPSPPRYIMLLNADTIMRPGALRELYDAAESTPEAGIISPRLEWPDGEAQISCFRYINPVSEMLRAASTGVITRVCSGFEPAMEVFDEPTEVQWTSFACALLRPEVLARIGLLDEGFFLYFDDPDYCRRTWREGWKVLHWPAAHVVHLRGQSNPVKSLTIERKRRPRYYYASRSRYFAKFYGRLGLLLSNLLWHVGRAVSWTREVAGGKEPHVCEGEYRDIWTNFLNPMKIHRSGDAGAS